MKSYLLASDYEGQVLRNQAINYMREYAKPDEHNIAKIVAEIEGAGIQEGSLKEDRNRVESQISIRTIVDDMNAIRGENVLSLVLQNSVISGKSVHTNTLASHRTLRSGQGHITINAETDEKEANRLFEQYICCKCSNYIKVLNNSALDYEVEYIISGKDSDQDNLEDIVLRLMEMRERANVDFLFHNAEKKSQARELAILILTGLGRLELEEALTDAILFAWGYAESVLDVNRLLMGGKVPTVKTSGDWRLPLEDLLFFRNYMGSGGGNGLGYEDYLHYYLYQSNHVDNRLRCMDIIEANVRLADNHQGFQLDGCLEYLEATVETKSDFGYQHNITRDFGYEFFGLAEQR